MTPDDKVKEYLERATTIFVNHKSLIADGSMLNFAEYLVEIAKMIQAEEHFQERKESQGYADGYMDGLNADIKIKNGKPFTEIVEIMGLASKEGLLKKREDL